MATASPQEVLNTSRFWLRPLIHILIRCGVTWREFADLAKATYVEVASEKFGKRGRLTNVSRTSVLTGLSRREVRRQRDLLKQTPADSGGYVTKACLVLSAWHLDPEFTEEGRPAFLSIEGERGSFAALVQRCAGSDVPMTTLLKELMDAGAVRQRPDGRLEVLTRNYIPHPIDEQLIRLWGSALTDIATTTGHNLAKAEQEPTRFERAAVNDRIDARAVAEFRTFLEQEGQAFLERVDAWLSAHQVGGDADDDAEFIRLGAGAYQIQDE
jgi:hypothetical protein